MPAPYEYEIEIHVSQDGVLSYSNKEGKANGEGAVKPLDRIRWKCTSHDYGIQFTNNVSPFQGDVLSLSQNKGKTTDPCTVKEPPIKKGRVPFKYVVSVHRPGSSNPIVIDDPVIIVDDG